MAGSAGDLTEEMDTDPENNADEPMQDESSDSDSDVNEDTEEEKHILELEDKIKGNPFHYDSHMEFIGYLRKTGNLDKLREAREAMAKIFPLTPELWLDWIKDESKLCESDEDKERVIQLFERAVKDYLSVALWLEYAQFSIGLMGSEGGLDRVRSVFERAITGAGLHVSQGALLWEAYREFEAVLLATMQVGPPPVFDARSMDAISQSISCAWLCFFPGMEKTYEELREWSEAAIEPSVEQQYKKAKLRLDKIQKYETDLLGGEGTPALSTYLSYLDFEEAQGDPTRVQSLYERAISDHCLVPELWERYMAYLDTKLKVDAVSLPCHERSVRNCPWSSSLWVSHLKALERSRSPHQKLTEAMEQALGAGFGQGQDYQKLWLTFLDYLRRRVDWSQGERRTPFHLCFFVKLCMRDRGQKRGNTLQTCVSHKQIPLIADATESHFTMQYTRGNYSRVLQLKIIYTWEQLAHATAGTTCAFYKIPEETDLCSPILKYWAKVEAKFCDNLPKARELWNEVTHQGRATDAQTWLDFANFERSLMPLYFKGIHPRLFSVWLVIPSLFSSSHSFEHLIVLLTIICSPKNQQIKKLAFITSKRALKSRKYGTLLRETSTLRASTEKECKRESDRKAERKKSRLLCRNGLRWLRVDVDAALAKDRTPVAGRPVFVSRCNERTQFKFQTGLEKNKLFVRGIPFSMDEKGLEEIFGKYGDLKQIRIVTYRNGHSKGIAYVEFTNETSATVALVQTDGMQLGKHTLQVAISNPPSRGPRNQNPQDSHGGPRPVPVASLGGGPKETGLRGRSRTQVSLMPRALQRPQPQKPQPQVKGETVPKDALLETKGLSNADFRNLLLKK
ncbi:unnamed protein product [Ixodes persulcatus]